MYRGHVTRAEISRVLAWERAWFRRALSSDTEVAVRVLRHAVSYLRAQGDSEGCALLLECLQKVRSSSALLRACAKDYPSHVLDLS
jgi:hypothetical protein